MRLLTAFIIMFALACLSARADLPLPVFDVWEASPPLKGRIALVIDDLGYNDKSAEILKLSPKITAAFLPDAPQLQRYKKLAIEQGNEIIIHMPMQSKSGQNEEASILKTGMSQAEMYQKLDRAFAHIPEAAGMNNHTGSLLTENTEAMRIIFAYLKQRGKYFLDSKTSADSVAESLSRELALPFIARHVFLDHSEDPADIAFALTEAERIAAEYGQVVVIGHPKQNTISALKHWLPELRSKGFEIVPLSVLIQPPADINYPAAHKAAQGHKN